MWNMIDIKRDLASMVYRFFDKKSPGSAVTCAWSDPSAMWDAQDKSAIENKILQNQELAEELYKPIIRKFEKWKVHSSFTDNICGADLADMQLIPKFNIHALFL